MQPTWSKGLAILRERQRQLPEALRSAFAAPLDLGGLDFSKYRGVLTTGIGSSSAHARYLSWILQNYNGIASWDVPTGAFLNPPGDRARDQVLIVFSQGLSPNARFPLAWAGHFGCTVLVTAAASERSERSDALQRARDAGCIIIDMPAAPEYEVLLRIVGPAVGYVTALRIAGFDGAHSAPDAFANAACRAEELLSGADSQLFSNAITFITSGGYGTLTSNLCAKVVEGMFLPMPAVADALEFAHGPLQEAAEKPRTFIALARGIPHEAELFDRVQATLSPQHRWLQFDAQLPAPFQIFEHEAAMNTLVLAAIASRRLDQCEWPGKGRDVPLYRLASIDDLSSPPPPLPAMASTKSHRLSDLTWTEVEARVKQGQATVVLPLGAVEQHGPHMPLIVDTLIADALAERLCLRIGAIQAPAVPVGCSSEHMDFPGTLSLEPSTLQAVLIDQLRSLVRHGFTRLVVFSAHGGNDATLAEIEPDLKIKVAPASLIVVHGIEHIGKAWAEASSREGVSPEASGSHAGEFETSIIAGLRPDLILWRELRKGVTEPQDDMQKVFYPSLRNNAPDGVVGDPRTAAAERSERYLNAWVDLLVAAYFL